MPSSLRGPKTLFEWLEPDYYRRSRWLRRWVRVLGWGGVLAGIIIVGLTLWGRPTFYEAGPLTSSHQMFSDDCQSCHTVPFRTASRLRPDAASVHSVTNEACSACHEGGPHHEDQQARVPACADCHHEHRGQAALVRVPDTDCVACHGDLHLKDGGTPGVGNVHAFATDHPPFALPKTDLGHIRFNHAVHLQEGGIFSTERDPVAQLPRRVKLVCTDCHQLDADRHYVRPVDYQAHCAQCHPLSVQLAGTWKGDQEPAAAQEFRAHPAPHVAAPEVREALRGRLTELVRAHPEIVAANVNAAPPRPVPGTPPSPPVAAGDARAWADYQLHSMEHVLFDGGDGCRRCHTEVPGSRFPDEPGSLPRYKPSNLLEHWLPSSVFDHGSHQMLQCVECHPRASKDQQAADGPPPPVEMLMPQIDTCRRCHNPQVGVRSACIDCHRYHDTSQNGWKGEDTIDAALRPSQKKRP